MENWSKNNRLSMQGPAVYRIKVQGRLDTAWSERLERMNITESHNAVGDTESILVGRLTDQAALSGVLNTLYELHFQCFQWIAWKSVKSKRIYNPKTKQNPLYLYKR